MNSKMNRRDVLGGIGAAATITPMMPNAALGAINSTPTLLLQHATYWAGLWGNTSLSTLKSNFYLSDAQAHLLMKDLEATKVIAPPTKNGMAKVLKQHFEPALSGKTLQLGRAKETVDPTPKVQVKRSTYIDETDKDIEPKSDQNLDYQVKDKSQNEPQEVDHE